MQYIRNMLWTVIVIVGVLLSEPRLGSSHRVVKRGIPVSGPNLNDQNNAAEYARKAGNAAITELNNNQNVASQSASSAVGQAVGRDYSNRLATTAQYVAQFTVPVTKEQANGVFNTVAQHQRAGDATQALAGNNRAIHTAASQAARSNYQQALQGVRGGYNRGNGGGSSGGGGGYGAGPWSSS